MSPLDMSKILYSVVAALLLQLLGYFLKRLAKETQQKFSIRTSRYFAMRRLITVTTLVLSIVALVFIWKINVKHAWVSMTGILALVAIAFFAMWSLIGNVLAGIIVYFTSPFKIEDTIEIMPDAIRGKVLAINTFYTVLRDKERDYINIPNSLLFQKYIKVLKAVDTERPVPPSHPDRSTGSD